LSGLTLGCGGQGRDSDPGAAGAPGDAVSDILNDPVVQSALDEVREVGIEIVTHTAREPPDITGYYFYELQAGIWVATGNGANVGFTTTALELRVDMHADATVDTASVSSFDGVTPAAHGMELGYLARGAGNEVTLYGPRQFTCDLDGSSYELWQAYIWTGTIDVDTGDWLQQKQFTVTTATDGELTTACAAGMVGNTEIVGGWAVADIPMATKISASELALMCVDESRGYVPGEAWKGTGGTPCECTADFTVSCES
jgi:hypothetical protein